MSLQIKFHESTIQILVYNCEPTIQWCKNPVSLLKGFLCYIFTPDPNPAEAVTMVPLLAEVSTRVIVLLDQFPENPLLEQVLKVKARVLALPARAPLPQLLIGLEQKNAHRGVSLQDQMDQLTQLILRRRKL